jgi:hypothetical protein
MLQAGTYRMNITPPLGICMAGSFGIIRARDVGDELYANALVLDDGATEIVLLSVDVCVIDTPGYVEICRQIADLTQIPPENVILTATHTHSGPATGMDLDGIYEVSADYVRQFQAKVASAARLAQMRKRPVSAGVGRGENRDYLFNRRLANPDGSIVMNWVDPEMLQKATRSETIDPEMLVLRVDDERGRPVAHVVNYANHNNAAPFDVISADYAGAMGDCLRAVYGPDLVVLFLPGAAGNVNWLDHNSMDRHDPWFYRRIGRSLAGTVLGIDARLEALDTPAIRVAQRKLTVRERPYRAYDVTVDGTFGPPERARRFFDAYRSAYERYADEPLPEHEVNVQVVQFGALAALCTNPAELFTEYGLAIKAASPFPYTLVAELTNGSVGYVPTPEAFAEGGYEVRKVPGGSYLAVDAGERITQAWADLLQGRGS